MQIQSLSCAPAYRPAPAASAQNTAPPDTFESGQDEIRFILKHTVVGAAVGGVGLAAAIGIGAGLIATAAGAPMGGAVGAGLIASVPAGIYGAIGGAILGTGVGMVRLLLKEG